MRCVVDASVAIKWFFQSAPDEADVDAAVALLRANRDGLADFHQPPHFIAEVAAVLARKKPDEAQADLGDLLEIDFRIINADALWVRSRQSVWTLFSRRTAQFNSASRAGQSAWPQSVNPYSTFGGT